MKKFSSRTEAGNAIYTCEANDDEKVGKIVPADITAEMRDKVFKGGKRAAIWVDEIGVEDSLDMRFATLDVKPGQGEIWMAHRLVCVPRNPAKGTEEAEMLEDFFQIMFRHASISGVSSATFSVYLKNLGLREL